MFCVRLLAVTVALMVLSSPFSADAYETTDCYTGERPSWVNDPWEYDDYDAWCEIYFARQHPWQIRQARLSEEYSRLLAAVERDHLPSIMALARLNDRGRLVIDRADDLVLRYPRNRNLAAELYERAASLGNVTALLKLAYYHRRGLGGYKRNANRAVNVYIRAAKSGDPAASPRAKTKLGWLISKQKVRVSPETCRMVRGWIMELANPDNALGSRGDRRRAQRTVSKWSRPCIA